jgi:hypothetical protein
MIMSELLTVAIVRVCASVRVVPDNRAAKDKAAIQPGFIGVPLEAPIKNPV